MNNNLIEKEENLVKKSFNWKGGVLVLIVLVVITFSFYKNSEKEDVSDDVLDNVDNVILEEENKANEVVVPKEKETEASKPAISTVDKQKFNDLMTNGSKAFLAKNYTEAIRIYNEALVLSPSDVVYIRLFEIYNIQGNVVQAQYMLNMAIVKNPSYTDYWNTKLVYLDEKTDTSFVDLKKIYNDGLVKVNIETKINLVTTFARIAESNKEYTEAIALFNYAKQENPENSSIYQQEIDRLNTR